MEGMFAFRKNSMTTKLTRMNMLVSGAALVIACAAFIAYDSRTFRENLALSLSSQAQIVGSTSVSALLFDDPQSVERTLSALSGSPNILFAGIYGPDKQAFAQYWRDQSGQTPPVPELSAAQTEVHKLKDGEMELVRRIVFQGRPVGLVVLRSDLRTLQARRLRYAGIAGVVLAASLLAALLASSVFQRAIARPMEELAQVARTVSHDKDYSVRAAPSNSRDELALLIDAFNEMLLQIEERESALRKAHDELEHRVAERTAQLTVANKELEAFSYSVSHDLRAPLRSIDGFSQALAEDCDDKLDEQGKGYLKRIRAAAQRMAELIDDLLNLSRMSRGECIRISVDLGHLALEVAAALRKSQPGRPVQFTISSRLEESADPRLMRVVLENLLGNAWKFTARREQARIEFGAIHQNATRVYFVRDNGAGFNMEYASRLFGAFQRLHTVQEFPGTGVGLATVQRIIHRHGGQVWAESEVDKGTTFYFTLQGGSPTQGGAND